MIFRDPSLLLAIEAAKQQLERERACPHETACWLPPDFWPNRYRCNGCEMLVRSLDELRRHKEAA